MLHWYTVLPLILCVAGYIWSVDKFCKTHVGGIRFGRLAFAIPFFLLFVGEMFVVEKFDIPYAIHIFSAFFLYMGLVLVMFRAEIEKKVLAVLLLMTIWLLVGNFADSIFSIATLFILKAVRGEAKAYIDMETGCCISCAMLVLVTVAINRLSGPLISVFQNKVKRWYLVLSVPLVFIIFLVVLVSYGASRGITVVSDANGAEYWNVFSNQVLSHIAMCILTTLSMCVVGFLVFGMNRIYEEQRSSERYCSQIAFYKMLEEQYSRMERLRHDMKNHVLALRGLLESQEWEAMEGYLLRMSESGSLGESEDVTGSKGVNALLYQKRKLAEEKGIKWECDVSLPRELLADEFDLCVLFGNILDNAIEACERLDENRERWIDIQSDTVKKCFLLEVKNSMDMGDPAQPGNTKKDMGRHGMGLLNVTDTVKRYNGVVNTEMEEGVFVISVLLPLEI